MPVFQVSIANMNKFILNWSFIFFYLNTCFARKTRNILSLFTIFEFSAAAATSCTALKISSNFLAFETGKNKNFVADVAAKFKIRVQFFHKKIQIISQIQVAWKTEKRAKIQIHLDRAHKS